MFIQAVLEQSRVVDQKLTAVYEAKNEKLKQGIIYEATKELEELERERDKLHNMLSERGNI